MDMNQIPNAIQGARNVKGYIHSFEGGIYLLSVAFDLREEYVTDPRTGRAMRFRSIELARRCAQNLGITDISLQFVSPYEEMIGLGA